MITIDLGGYNAINAEAGRFQVNLLQESLRITEIAEGSLVGSGTVNQALINLRRKDEQEVAEGVVEKVLAILDSMATDIRYGDVRPAIIGRIKSDVLGED